MSFQEIRKRPLRPAVGRRKCHPLGKVNRIYRFEEGKKERRKDKIKTLWKGC